jgi:putative transcriptional regulator
MLRIVVWYRILALLVFCLPTAAFGVLSSGQAETTAPPSLKGQLLIATPAMSDPRFERAVILMVQHDRSGAFGLVINRPLGDRPLADILAAFGKKEAAPPAGNVPVFLGGPVQPEVSFVIHGSDYSGQDTLAIDAHLAATPGSSVLDDMARNQGPAKHLIIFGYAGWAPGQLEGELARNVWYTAPADAGLVFDDDRDKVWEHAVARRTQDL